MTPVDNPIYNCARLMHLNLIATRNFIMSLTRMAVTATLLSYALILQHANATLLSGNVTDISTSQPLQGATVEVFESFPDAPFDASTTTNADGSYQIDVPQGFPQITASLGNYVPQTQQVSLNATPLTVDFALYVAASIAGTVKSASTGHALANATVSLLDAQSKSIITQTSAGNDGTYSFTSLMPGQYAACVIDATDIYLDSCYNGKTVGADGVPNFTPIALVSGQNAAGINFSLQVGATLAGTLYDSYFNIPIVNAPIEFTLYSSQHAPVAAMTVTTDANGGFTLSGLAAGSYYLEAGSHFIGYNTNAAYTLRLYGGGECATPLGDFPQCPFATGTLINVPMAGASGINLGLFPGYIVTGKVTDAQTGTGVPNVALNACDNPSGLLTGISGTAVTDASGDYTLAHAVGAQTHIATIDAPGFLNVVWQDAVTLPSYSCVDTTIFGGNALSFSSPDEVLPNVNFALQHGAAISGTIAASDVPNMPISSKVSLYSTDGQWVTTIGNDADGNYTTPGVAAGTYFVATFFDNGADCQVYNGTSCGNGWDATDPSSVDLTSATPITLTGTQIQSGVNLQLKVTIFQSGFN